MDDQSIVLVNVPKGIIGEDNSSLLAGFIVAMFQKAALSRADTPNRPPYYLYLDEFQNYTTDNIKDVLAESRKYALSLVMAHQYLEQLSKELRAAVLATSGTIACFRCGAEDALTLARYVFPGPDYQRKGDFEFGVQKLGDFPYLQVRERWQDAGLERLAQSLSNQSHRQFWLRRKGPQRPISLRTQDVQLTPMTSQLADAIQRLRAESGRRFGRHK